MDSLLHLPPPVVLTVTATVNGTPVTAQHMVQREEWDRLNPEARAAMEEWVRRRLGEAIVQHLDPPVTVDRPVSVGEGVRDAEP